MTNATRLGLPGLVIVTAFVLLMGAADADVVLRCQYPDVPTVDGPAVNPSDELTEACHEIDRADGDRTAWRCQYPDLFVIDPSPIDADETLTETCQHLDRIV